MSGIKRYIYISLIFLLTVNNISAVFPPSIKWEEIKSRHFIIIFPETYDKTASSISIKAESIYTELSRILNIEIKKKVRILISDFSDEFTSNSTIFPFCQIRINLAQSFPDRIYGSFKDPFYFFLSKEISKIFFSNIKGGPINSLRKIFGNHPFLSPMLLLPGPVYEGYSTLFSLILNKLEKIPDELIYNLTAISGSRKFPSLTKISGNYSEWPTKFSKYIFGSGFILFLYDNFEVNSLINLIKSYATKPVKYKTDIRIEKYLLKKYNNIWNDFYDTYKNNNNRDTVEFSTVDQSGMIQRYPVFINEDSILYFKNNFRESLQFVLKNKTGTYSISNNNDVSGISYDTKTNKLYYSTIISSTPYFNYSELFELDLQKQKKSQLSFGERLFEPEKIPDKNIILCIKRKKLRSHIIEYDLNTRKTKILSKGFSALSQPTLSPDKKYIACSIKHNDKYWRIGIFNRYGSFIRFITNEDTISYYPKWKKTDELFYISKNNGRIDLHSYNFDNNEFYIYDGPGNYMVKYFSFSNKKDKIAFTYLKDNGYNTVITKFSKLRKIRLNIIQNNIPVPAPEKNELSKPIRINNKKYKSIRDLIPKYFSFSFYNAGNEVQPGITTIGSDILKRNEYELNLFYGFKKKNISYDLKYRFKGLYQDIRLNTYIKHNLNQDKYGQNFSTRTIGTQILFKHPLIYTENHKAFLAFDLHFEKLFYEYDISGQNGSINRHDLDNNIYNGFGLSILYNSSKKYYDSISDNDGFNISFTFSKDIRTLGSKFNSNTFFFEYKHFISIFRPNVLTFRLGIVRSWGEHQRGIFMGGTEAFASIDPMKNKFLGLMRGFPSGFFYGTSGYLLNTEYRISLLKVEDTVLFLPYLERIYISLFTDIGELVSRSKFLKPSISYGAEFIARFNLSSPITLACGVAKGKNPDHKIMFYMRLENSF